MFGLESFVLRSLEWWMRILKHWNHSSEHKRRLVGNIPWNQSLEAFMKALREDYNWLWQYLLRYRETKRGMIMMRGWPDNQETQSPRLSQPPTLSNDHHIYADHQRKLVLKFWKMNWAFYLEMIPLCPACYWNVKYLWKFSFNLLCWLLNVNAISKMLNRDYVRANQLKRFCEVTCFYTLPWVELCHN